MRKYIKAAALQHWLLRVHCFSADSAILNERPDLNARNDPKIAVTSCCEKAHVIQRDCRARHSQKFPKFTAFSYENEISERNTVSLSSLEFESAGVAFWRILPGWRRRWTWGGSWSTGSSRSGRGWPLRVWRLRTEGIREPLRWLWVDRLRRVDHQGFNRERKLFKSGHISY